MDYDHKAVQFQSISAYYYGALAIDQNGKLWAWGQNNNHLLGFDS